MKLYVYCVCADLAAFDKPVSGVSGARVRVLKIEDFSVLVSECDSVPVNRDNALAHAAVVRSVLEQTTPLPFRFGTLATEQQLRSFITTNKAALANKFEHLRGCVEMDLKTEWRHSTPQAQPDPAAGPGTEFLKKKRRELLGDERTAAQRNELSAILHQELGSLIKDENMGLQPSETGVLGKVFHLVESSKIKEYREKVATLVQTRPDLQLEVSGPWPPYSFANIELEFGSQFGVS